ncbi:hypothetical protein KTO58_07765 [Chitinophaga pendula]|uniref:hypothetical protein n=1 Tax=Chitinophaga TaxID=79328 RepID=UPI0012FE35E6|nr:MULTISPECIES: hypothetical protein [Chitinophaga]UCJ09067.1 hypothetical protein KTO58_07765 [Chitinophaga pendula]
MRTLTGFTSVPRTALKTIKGGGTPTPAPYCQAYTCRGIQVCPTWCYCQQDNIFLCQWR